MVRCDYCGMAYDGDEYDNCPHCMAPRSDDDANVVFQRAEPRQQVNCLYADNVLYMSIPSGSSDSEAPVEPGPTVPETYGTVERDGDAWLAYVIPALVVVATFVNIAYIIFT